MIQSVLAEVQAERYRQDAKWGEQNHPDGTGDPRHLCRAVNLPTYGTLAYRGRSVTDAAAKAGNLTYADIFVEEVFEALAEDDPARLRAELVQAAAVAVAWVEAIDRRRGDPDGVLAEFDRNRAAVQEGSGDQGRETS